MKIVYDDAGGVPVLFDNSIRIGLGLYGNVIRAIIFEVLVTGAGIVIYIFTLKKLREEKQLFENVQKMQGGKK